MSGWINQVMEMFFNNPIYQIFCIIVMIIAIILAIILFKEGCVKEGLCAIFFGIFIIIIIPIVFGIFIFCVGIVLFLIVVLFLSND